MPSIAFVVGLLMPPVIVSLIASNQSWIERFANLATIVTAFAVVIAYVEYISRREQEDVLSTVQQINFFRTVILEQYEKIAEKLKKENPEIVPPRLGHIEQFNYGWAYIEKKEIFQKLSEHEEKITLEDAIRLLNALEEFSWNVILHKTIGKDALVVVHSSFVQLVEEFAHRILLMRVANQNLFPGTIALYKCWEPKIVRKSPDELVDDEVHRYRTTKNPL